MTPTSTKTLEELISVGIEYSGPDKPWLGGEYVDDAMGMARPWEIYINGIYHLDEMISHQPGGGQASKIDSMTQEHDDSITPYEIKYSTHNAMRNTVHHTSPVSFVTTTEQIACLQTGGMVLHPTDRIWWPIDDAKHHDWCQFEGQDLIFSNPGYFIVGCVWKSQETDAVTAQWIKISYNDFYNHFNWEGKP